MNRSTLINHINHLKLEIEVLKQRRDVRLELKKLDAILIYDTSITLLESRLKECEAELKQE